MTGSVPRDLDALLAHADWVQRLSVQLCRDQHAAADAAQETWLQALRARPDARGSAQGFLATVLHNVVRMRGRTARRVERRERKVAGPGGLAESAADACARAELQQFVVREVLALPEPQKALVLLHYFEGRGVAELAREHGMSADAVRSHLRRARDTLRLRLQGHDGPARRAFAALLLANGSALPWGLVGAIMAIGIKTKLVSAAAVVAIAAWALWQFDGPTVQPAVSTDLVASSPAAAPPTVANTTSNASEQVQRTAASVPGTAAPEPRLRCQLTGLRAEAPWTVEVELLLDGPNGAPASLRAMPDADGAFAFVLPEWTARGAFEARFVADDPNYLAIAAREKIEAFATSRLATEVVPIVVHPVAICVGKVVDFRGAPVSARVSAFVWRDGRPREPRTDAPTLEGGEFVLEVPMATELFLVAVAIRGVATDPRGAYLYIKPVRNDLLPATVRARTSFGTRTDVGVLTLPIPAMITGEVRDPQGRPVADERVYWYPGEESEVDLELDRDMQLVGGTWNEPMLAAATKTDAEGRFRLPGRAGAQGWLHLMNGRDFDRYEPFVHYRDVRAPADVTIQLGGNTAVVRVVRGGKPVPGVWIRPDPPGESTAAVTDERGEVRLLREHAKVQQLSVRGGGPVPIAVELPLDTAPDRPIVIELADTVRAVVTFDVTSAVPVQQFGARFQIATAKTGSVSVPVTRLASGELRCEVAPGDYRLEVYWSNKSESGDAFVMRQSLPVLVPASGVRVPLTLQHGGRIRIQARDRDGLHLAGEVTLAGPAVATMKPRLDHGPNAEYRPDGKLPGTGPAVTYVPLAPGTWEVTLDLGTRGIHRRTVEVRACEIAEVDVTVQ